jgi:hypothetical protein
MYHKARMTEFQMPEVLEKDLKYFYFFLGIDTQSLTYYAHTLTQEGICKSYNVLNANLIFRNETVDPEFLAQYQSKESGTNPHFWSIEEGYVPDKIDNYPLRAYDNGQNSGFTIHVKDSIEDEIIQNMDTTCRRNPTNLKIALHHPAEVVDSKKFVDVPFNKSMKYFVKPKISKISENLKSYDPSV